jgi:hypothetical protein
MRNLIGFDTPSKTQAQGEMKSQAGANSPRLEAPQVNVAKLKMETIIRLKQLGDAITSPQFQMYEQEQKQQILMDFAYYSKVADSLM